MKKNSILEGFYGRFQAILDAFDAFEPDEELEEMNAEFEDTLFMLESIDEDDDSSGEEIADFLEDMEGLVEDYRGIAQAREELRQTVFELEMAVRMARDNMI